MQNVRSEEECDVFQENSRVFSSEEYLDNQLSDCKKYIQASKVPWHEKYEREMPLAFSVIAHRDASQLAKLLSAIFRPWNSYCLQIDSKSSPEFTAVVTKLVQCYNSEYPSSSIFLSQSSVSIIWSHISLLEADLACMEQLMQRNQDWQYFINMAGSEYPVKTNYQLISKLAGSENDIGFVHSVFAWPGVETRWKYSHKLPEGQEDKDPYSGDHYHLTPYQTDKLKEPPPHNLTIMVGVKNVAITREFSGFLLYSGVAKVRGD